VEFVLVLFEDPDLVATDEQRKEAAERVGEYAMGLRRRTGTRLWRSPAAARTWSSSTAGAVRLRLETAQGDSGATPNPTTNLRHQMTALLNAERCVPVGMT
jgi:hypothetical protein